MGKGMRRGMRGTQGERPLVFDAGRSVPLCFGVVLLGLIVQCASWIKGDTLVFPGVPAILRAFFRLLGEGRTWTQIGVTLGHLAATLGIASVIGILLGLAQGLSAFVYRLFRPLMSFLRAIPMIVLTVIVMVMTVYERVPVAASSAGRAQRWAARSPSAWRRAFSSSMPSSVAWMARVPA